MPANSPTSPRPLPSPPPARAHRLAYLDGLRALAALWVLFSHVFAYTLGATVTSPGLLGIFAHYGHLAVDLFIVLSGYCLMLPIVRHGHLGGSVTQFYKRRALRILPPYYAALALALAPAVEHFIVKGGVLPPWRAVGVNLLLLQDWLVRANVFDSPTWSVAVEWKIYFLFPALVWAWRRRGPLAALGLAAAVGYAVTLIAHACGIGREYACPWYTVLFGLGVAACALRGRLGRAALTGLCVAGCVGAAIALRPSSFTHWWNFAALDTCVGLCAAAALALLHDAPSQGLLTWRPLVSLGTFSYSLYLAHMPILLMLITLSLHTHHFWHIRHAPQVFALVAIASAIGGSYLFFLCFERPFLASRRRETRAELARDAALSPAP